MYDSLKETIQSTKFCTSKWFYATDNGRIETELAKEKEEEEVAKYAY